MKVMGIDPGTIKLGIGIVENSGSDLVPLYAKTLSLNTKVTIHKRLHKIFTEILALVEKWQPDVVALEDVYYGMSFKSAIRIGEARSAVILAATQCGIEVHEYPPARVKSAVSGFGRASKIQIQNMVKSILSLKELPATDAADALALAICHINMSR